MIIDASQATADLQARWHTLHDVDRAACIAEILGAETGRRALARSLNVSEGLIRHLTLVNEALPEEKELARQGKISTNRIVKLVKERRKRQAADQREREAAESGEAARQGAKHITTWLRGKLSAGYAEQVVDEARRLLAHGEATGKLPKEKTPKGMKFDEIVRRCEEKRPENGESDFIPRYAWCLAVASFYAMPDPEVRDRALNLAWGAVIRS